MDTGKFRSSSSACAYFWQTIAIACILALSGCSGKGECADRRPQPEAGGTAPEMATQQAVVEIVRAETLNNRKIVLQTRGKEFEEGDFYPVTLWGWTDFVILESARVVESDIPGIGKVLLGPPTTCDSIFEALIGPDGTEKNRLAKKPVVFIPLIKKGKLEKLCGILELSRSSIAPVDGKQEFPLELPTYAAEGALDDIPFEGLRPLFVYLVECPYGQPGGLTALKFLNFYVEVKEIEGR